MNGLKLLWIKLSQIGLEDRYIISHPARLILNCNRLTIIVGLILLLNLVFYGFYGLSSYAFFHFVLILLLLPVFILNKSQLFTSASLYLIYFCNFGIFCLDSMTGKAAANYVYFINVILLNFFIFNYSQKYLMFLNFIITSLLMIILEYTNHSLFIDSQLTLLEQKYIFLFTIVSNTILIFFSMYCITMNQAKTEDLLQEEEKILNCIYNFNPLGIALINRDKRIKSYNLNFKNNIKRLSGQEIQIGDEFTQYLPERERVNFDNYFNLTLEERIIRIEKNFKMDYTSLWFDIMLSPIILEKKCNGVVLSFLDISERKNLEINSHIAKEKAEVANVAKSHFLSTVSNEIRSPMNDVIEITNNLLESNPFPEQIPRLFELKSSTENLLHLINDILDYEIIEVDSVKSGFIQFDFISTFLFVREFYQNRIQQKGLDFKYYVDDRIPKNLVGDPVRLRQIIMHLLNNSIKFTDKGEISFRADLKESNKENITIIFSIRDTGNGIATKKLEKIVQEINEGDTRKIVSSRTFGLGFTIIKKLLELLGSKISIESEAGVGSKFTFNVMFYLPGNSKVETLSMDNSKGKK